MAAGLALAARLDKIDKKIYCVIGDGESRASLHEKAFVIDRRTGFIGSMNFDPRSFRLNTEIGIFFQFPAKAAAMAGWFDRHIDRLAYRLELEADGEGGQRIVGHYRGDDGDTVYQLR